MSTRTRTPDAITMPDVVARVSPIGDAPTPEGLAWALRHPEMWPEGFEWDYGNCRTCAVGLSSRLWRQLNQSTCGPWATIHGLGEYLGMTTLDALRIFAGQGAEVGGMELVTPKHVADAIDRYLATRA